jgi:hypothetical protein
MEQLFLPAISALTGGILADVMAVMMSVINIIIILVGFRIVYSAITGSTVVPSTVRDWMANHEYSEVYEEELERYQKNKLRARARDEIFQKYGGG